MRKLATAAVLALLATPVFAQSYTPTYGTGNVINQPLAERTNGALGVGASVSAYSPRGQTHHRVHRMH